MTLQLRDSITGDYASRRVWIQTNTKDYELLPRRSQELRNHSPDGFAWGYEGSGPAQFALALLLEAGMSDEEALSAYQEFKHAVISYIPHKSFWLPASLVLGWILGYQNRDPLSRHRAQTPILDSWLPR